MDGGVGYGTAPTITIAGPSASGIAHTAVGIASIGVDGNSNVLKSIYVKEPGRGYSSPPTVTISDPETLSGLGTYFFNEIVYGSRSLLEARVKEWDKDTFTLKVSNVAVGATQPRFSLENRLSVRDSGASYPVKIYTEDNTYDKYTENDEFEVQADKILDFSESNPFGTF